MWTLSTPSKRSTRDWCIRENPPDVQTTTSQCTNLGQFLVEGPSRRQELRF